MSATRKRAATKIRRQVDEEGLSAAVRQQMLADLLKPLLRGFADEVEKVRELSIETVEELMKTCEDPAAPLPYLATPPTAGAGGYTAPLPVVIAVPERPL